MNETFFIQQLVDNPVEFEERKSELKNLILSNFESRHDVCKINVDDSDLEITKGQLLLNLFLLSLFKGRGLHLTKDDLFLKDSISGGDIESYLNHVLTRIKEEEIDFDSYRQSVYEFLNQANDLSATTNILAGNTIDFLDFVEIELQDPEASHLFEAPSVETLQFNEIEEKFSKKGSELMNYFSNHKNTNLSAFTRSNTGINKNQFTQTLGFVGLKPGFNGNVIPKVVKTNFLKGATTIEDYYISATGARLALATNFNFVRKSGYFTRKLSLLVTDLWHDANYHDCGTKHYVEYFVSTNKRLDMIDGRHYYTIVDGKPDYDHLKTIHAESDSELIGTTIALRSPITCLGNKPGGHICKTCYGSALAEINKNLHTGLAAVLLLTNILTQRLLSAKHLLTTNTDKIDWGDDFTDAFVIEMDNVYFSDDTKVELLMGFPTEESYDEDMEAYAYTEFDIKFIDDKRTVHYVSPTPLYLKDELIPKKAEELDVFAVQSDSYGTNAEIFKFIPHNNMLSKSLQNILDLIESSSHLGVTTYDELVNTFADLLIENNMSSIYSVHAEMICSKLIVDAQTKKAVDWSKDILDPYIINRVSKSVLSSPISTSLAFERLGEQLSSIETYLKDDESIMDSLFN